MKLSIVTVVYADIRGLHSTCRSVDAQIRPAHEHIIVASGFSNEEKLSLQSDLARANRAFYFDLDRSIYNAMNLGLRRAAGDSVLFLNAGDVFISKQSTNWIAMYGAEGRCCAFSTAQTDGDISYIRSPGKWKKGILCYPGHQGFVAPLHESIEERIYFNEENFIAADREWMETCMHTYGVDAFSDVIAEFSLGGVSNLPSWSAFVLQFKAKRYTEALKLIPKALAYVVIGRRRYYYALARMKGYGVETALRKPVE